MAKEGYLTLGGRYLVQYTVHVSSKCTLEVYIILLTNVTLIILILKISEIFYCLSNKDETS